MRLLLLLACLGCGTVSLSGQDDALKTFPHANIIARHYMENGAKDFTRGGWRVTFSNAHWIGGDMFLGSWDVTVKGRLIGSVREYHSRMSVQVGHLCDHGVLFGTAQADGTIKLEDADPVRTAEMKRRKEAGDCPDYALYIWRTD